MSRVLNLKLQKNDWTKKKPFTNIGDDVAGTLSSDSRDESTKWVDKGRPSYTLRLGGRKILQPIGWDGVLEVLHKRYTPISVLYFGDKY